MAVEVKLPAFEGPLDLLLHLIEKNQVDIYDIPIYEITQQYLLCLDEWNKKNMEIASEFIVMAATLINIKAKMLLPMPKQEEMQEDPREELIRRLLEYRRYKDAAGKFRLLVPDPSRLWLCRRMEKITIPPQIPPVDRLLAGQTTESLYEMYTRVLRSQRESVDPLRSTFKSVAKDSYTIEEKIQDLMQTLEALQTVSYYSLRERSETRQEEITYFLAMLELSRNHNISLQQERAFADIIMSFQQEPPEPEHMAETITGADREEAAYPVAYTPPELPILASAIEYQESGGEPEDDQRDEGIILELIQPGRLPTGESEPKKEYAAGA